MDEQPTTISHEEAANLLVGAQQFASGGLKSKIDGKISVPGAALSNKVVALAMGSHLEETLLLNVHLQDKKERADDIPCWEGGGTRNEKPRACRGSCDSYANQHLAYRFVHEKMGVRRVICDGGHDIINHGKDNFRDPMTTIVVRKNGEGMLTFSGKKSLWRDFPSLVRGENRPQVLNWARDRIEGKAVPIIAGGVSFNKAKIEYWLEAFYNLPKALLEEDNFISFKEMMTATEKDIIFLDDMIKRIEKGLHGSKKVEIKGRILRDQYLNLMEGNFSQFLETLSDGDWEKAENEWVEKRKESIRESWEEHKRSMGGSYQALIQIAKIDGRIRGYIGKIEPTNNMAD